MFYIILVSSIILDYISKQFALNYLENKINIFGDFIYLQYIQNPGIAFGIKIYPLLLKIITISLIIAIFYYYRNEKKENNSKLLDISFGLIIGGAIGNAIERVFYSNVIDFIGVKYFSIFNFADSFISIGAIIYIYILFKNKKTLCNSDQKK